MPVKGERTVGIRLVEVALFHQLTQLPSNPSRFQLIILKHESKNTEYYFIKIIRNRLCTHDF